MGGEVVEFFRRYFGDGLFELNNGEYAVCCPFPHTDNKGHTYFENRPSAHINPNKSVFHCKVCDASHSETSFLSQTQGISYGQAIKLLSDLESRGKHHTSWSVMVENLKSNEQMMEVVTSLGLESMIDTLEIGYRGDGISFPV